MQFVRWHSASAAAQGWERRRSVCRVPLGTFCEPTKWGRVQWGGMRITDLQTATMELASEVRTIFAIDQPCLKHLRFISSTKTSQPNSVQHSGFWHSEFEQLWTCLLLLASFDRHTTTILKAWSSPISQCSCHRVSRAHSAAIRGVGTDSFDTSIWQVWSFWKFAGSDRHRNHSATRHHMVQCIAMLQSVILKEHRLVSRGLESRGGSGRA